MRAESAVALQQRVTLALLLGLAAAAWALFVVNTRPWAFEAPWRAAWPVAAVLLGPLGAAAFVRRCTWLREETFSVLDRWVAARAYDLAPFVAVSFLVSALGAPVLLFVPDTLAGLGSSTAVQEAIAGTAATAGIAIYQMLLPRSDERPWWRLAILGGQLAAVAAAAWASSWFRLSYLPLHAVPSETALAWWTSALLASALGLVAALPFDVAAGLLPGAPVEVPDGDEVDLAVPA